MSRNWHNFIFIIFKREFDSILIFLQHFDLNLLNPIPKFKNLNIQHKILLQPQLNNSYKFHVCQISIFFFVFLLNIIRIFRRTWCRFLSNWSLGSTINIRSRSSRYPSSSFITYSSSWSSNGRFSFETKLSFFLIISLFHLKF